MHHIYIYIYIYYSYAHPYLRKRSGLDVNTYRYLNRDTQGLDLEGFLADVNNAPNGSAFLIHACAVSRLGLVLFCCMPVR